LLRYGYHNILGLYVNPDNPRCCKEALILRQKLQAKGVSLEQSHFYQISEGHFSAVPSKKLAEIAATDKPNTREVFLAKRPARTASVFKGPHGGAGGGEPAPK
jgi:hypothetical protein